VELAKVAVAAAEHKQPVALVVLHTVVLLAPLVLTCKVELEVDQPTAVVVVVVATSAVVVAETTLTVAVVTVVPVVEALHSQTTL
jgi:hypothetical protein